MKQITVIPTPENTERVSMLVEQELSDSGCPLKLISKLNIAVDEIYSNIYRYSKATSATISCSFENEEATIRFTDDGIPYDPTVRPEPDTTLSAADRTTGGLGIFMVKKLMDTFTYERIENKNVLTIKKRA